MIIGVISDTHGLLRPEAVEALSPAELIRHGGDIGSPEIIPALERIAPVIAIRGNVDTAEWARAYPETRMVEACGLTAFLIHDVQDFKPAADQPVDLVISGHSHKARDVTVDGIRYLNPGSAGPRRFKLPVTVGLLRVAGGRVEFEVVSLA